MPKYSCVVLTPKETSGKFYITVEAGDATGAAELAMVEHDSYHCCHPDPDGLTVTVAEIVEEDIETFKVSGRTRVTAYLAVRL